MVLKPDVHGNLRSLCIVVPVYNDWASFGILLDKLDAVAQSLPVSVFVMGVDDGSLDEAPQWEDAAARWNALEGVEVVRLAANLGHQRAIAIGLCVAVGDHEPDAVLVMDADGEDPPERIETLLAHAAGKKDFVIVAQRRKRSESFAFQVSYYLYKIVFRALTGRKISFGNFSLISRNYVRRLVMVPDLWNQMAAALLRSRLPVERVPIDRGRRYAGKSKMNFVSLLVHGMSGISVYVETIYVRLLLLTGFMALLILLGVPVLFVLRLFYPLHATPGWATTVSFGLIIIFLQFFLTALTSILTVLNNRVQRLVIPFADYKTYIAEKSMLHGRKHL